MKFILQNINLQLKSALRTNYLLILPNINLQLKSALRTKYLFYQTLLYLLRQKFIFRQVWWICEFEFVSEWDIGQAVKKWHIKKKKMKRKEKMWNICVLECRQTLGREVQPRGKAKVESKEEEE